MNILVCTIDIWCGGRNMRIWMRSESQGHQWGCVVCTKVLTICGCVSVWFNVDIGICGMGMRSGFQRCGLWNTWMVKRVFASWLPTCEWVHNDCLVLCERVYVRWTNHFTKDIGAWKGLWHEGASVVRIDTLSWVIWMVRFIARWDYGNGM